MFLVLHYSEGIDENLPVKDDMSFLSFERNVTFRTKIAI